MTICNFLNRIKAGRLVLPAIQRYFSWSEKRIFRLLDSVMQGYPIGLLVVWETYNDIHYRNFSIDLQPGQATPIGSNSNHRKLAVVLDGQQRLQSLYCSLHGTYRGKHLYLDVLSGQMTDEATKLKYRFRFMDASEYRKWQIGYFQSLLKQPPGAGGLSYFVRMAALHSFCASQKVAFRKQLVKEMMLCPEDQERVELNINGVDDVFSRNTNILKAAVIDEDLPSDAPQRKTEADVLEIFLRINREGAPLSRSDLIFSVLKLNWKESAVALPEFVRQINCGNSFNLDTNFVIRCLFAVSGLGTRFEPDLLRKPSMIEQIRTHYPRCCDAIRATIDLVIGQFHCATSELTGGNGTLVPLVYYLFHTPNHALPEGQMRNVRKSFYLFAFARTFATNTESRLRKFVRREIQPLAEHGDTTFPFSSAVGWVKYWQGHTAFGAALLQSNPRLAMHVLQDLYDTKAQYWRNAGELDHIFPRSELAKRGFEGSDVDHFANLWILPKGLNMNKSNMHPADYFRDVRESETAVALIDRDLLQYNCYKTFLRKRGQRIVEEIRNRLDITDHDFRVPVFRFKRVHHGVSRMPAARVTVPIPGSLSVAKHGVAGS